MEEVIEAATLKYNTAAAQADLERLENVMGNLAQQQIDLQKRQKDLQDELKTTGKFSQDQAKEWITNKAKLQEVGKALSQNTKDYKAQRAILAENATGVRGLTDLLTKDIKTRGEAKKVYGQLVQAQDQINISTTHGREQMEMIKDRMEEVNDVIKENSDSNQKAKINVGAYSAGIQEVIDRTGFFIQGAKNGAQAITGMGSSLTKGKKGWDLMRVAAISFTAVPIIAILTGLVMMLSKNQKAMDMLKVGISAVEGVLSMLSGKLMDFTDWIIKAFTDPQQALKDFRNFLKDQVVNRFTGLLELFPAIGKAIKAAFSGDFKGAAEIAGNAVGKVTLGVENAATKVMKFGNEVFEAGEKAANLTKITQQLEKINIAIEGQLVALDHQSAKWDLIANDSTRSLLEQEKASKKAMEASIKAADERLKIAKNHEKEIEVILEKARNEGRKTQDQLLNDEKRRINEIRREVSEAELAKFEAIESNAQLRRQILSDLAEQELDVLIDGFDNVLQINTRKIANEKLTFEQKEKLLKETERLAKKSLDNQVKVLQKAAKREININDLLKESDATVLKEKIKNTGLSEILSNRLLEVIRERRLAEQDFNEIHLDLSKERIEQKRKEVQAMREAFLVAAELEISNEERKHQLKKIAQELAFIDELDELEAQGASKSEILLAQLEHEEQLKLDSLENQRKMAIAQANLAYQEGAISQQELNDRKQLINKQYELDYTRTVKEGEEARTQIIQTERDKIMELLNDHQEQILFAESALYFNQLSLLHQFEMSKREKLLLGFDLAKGLATSLAHEIGQIQQMQTENELTKLHERRANVIDHYDQLIVDAEGNAEEQERLEEEKQAALAELEDKAEALKIQAEIRALKVQRIGVIANGIALVAKTLASLPYPANLIVAPFAALQAGLQLRNINSQLSALGVEAAHFDFNSSIYRQVGDGNTGGSESGSIGIGSNLIGVDSLDIGDINVGETPEEKYARRIGKMEEDHGPDHEDVKQAYTYFDAWKANPSIVTGNLLSNFLTSKGYKEGTDFLTGIKGRNTSRDNIPIWAEEGEMIFTNAQREMMGGKTRAEIIQDVLLADHIKSSLNFNSNFDDDRMVGELKGVRKDLKGVNPTAIFADVEQVKPDGYRLRSARRYKMKKYR